MLDEFLGPAAHSARGVSVTGADVADSHTPVEDALEPGANVLVIDDLIATGGTAAASINLIRSLGGNVAGCAFIIDLPEIGGAAKLESMGVEVKSLVVFEGH